MHIFYLHEKFESIISSECKFGFGRGDELFVKAWHVEFYFHAGCDVFENAMHVKMCSCEIKISVDEMAYSSKKTKKSKSM